MRSNNAYRFMTTSWGGESCFAEQAYFILAMKYGQQGPKYLGQFKLNDLSTIRSLQLLIQHDV